MWILKAGKKEKKIVARDESRRDEKQGGVSGSAYRGVKHLIDMCDAYDMMTIGWIYVNPADKEVARYIRAHADEIRQKKPEFKTDKFFVYTLVHRGKEKTPDEVDPATPFGMMLQDIQGKLEPGKPAPYGTINLLTKGNANDLGHLGKGTTSESFRKDIVNTIRLIRQANPKINIEIALEHIYTGWLLEKNRETNREHIINTLVDYLLETDPRSRRIITAPDTDGAHTPEDIRQAITEITAALQKDARLLAQGIRFDPKIFTAHMHDDLGKAAENTIAALQAGAGACDSNTVEEGERKGNATAASLMGRLHTSSRRKIEAYKIDMDRRLGIRSGDHEVGGEDSFCATGGMHADEIYKHLREAQAKGKTYDEAIADYDGPYASVPAQRFGRKLQVALSPVGGASNVLVMLSALGLDIDDKKDPRIAEVLTEVKDGEHLRGINYRGYNNTNAFLLLADKFGLRSHAEGRNRLRVISRETDGYDSGTIHHIALQLSTHAGEPPTTREWGTGHRSNGFTHMDEVRFDTDLAQRITHTFKAYMAQADKRFGDIELLQSRRLEAPVGPVSPTNGDASKPKAQQLVAVKCIFTTGTPEKFQANGVGKTYEQAMAMALETMFDYRAFQIERENKAKGLPPLLDLSGIHANQREIEAQNAITRHPDFLKNRFANKDNDSPPSAANSNLR